MSADWLTLALIRVCHRVDIGKGGVRTVYPPLARTPGVEDFLCDRLQCPLNGSDGLGTHPGICLALGAPRTSGDRQRQYDAIAQWELSSPVEFLARVNPVGCVVPLPGPVRGDELQGCVLYVLGGMEN